MELLAPKQSCPAHSEKTGTPGVTLNEGFHDRSADPDVNITGWTQARNLAYSMSLAEKRQLEY